MKNKPIHFGSTAVYPGERLTIALPTPEIYTIVPMYIPIHVIHGKKKGPSLLLCSVMHGNEANGIALIQRLMQSPLLNMLHGTLLAMPVMNTYGLLTNARTVPSQRNLEGSFPGSVEGSFISRLAHHIRKEILSKADYCIDIHSGAPHYHKWPQIQTDMEHEGSKMLAEAFRAPLIIHTKSKKGMLWQLQEENKPTIVYETGEAQRLDEFGIRTGIRGILYVMKNLGMLKLKESSKEHSSTVMQAKNWIRATSSGLCTHVKKVGTAVEKGELIFKISDPFGSSNVKNYYAPENGIVVGCNHLPLVNEGDAIVEIAYLSDTMSRIEDDLNKDFLTF